MVCEGIVKLPQHTTAYNSSVNNNPKDIDMLNK